MRLVAVERDRGKVTVSVAYMWLPTFLGLATALHTELEEKVKPMLEGKELSDELLDAAHEAILDTIEQRFPEIKGLRDYIDALKFVEATK